MRTSIHALVAVLGCGAAITVPPPSVVLAPNDAWATSLGADGTATSPAVEGGSGAIPRALNTVTQDPTSSFRQKVIAFVDRPPGDWVEKSANYITVCTAIASRKGVRQVEGWCEGNTLTVTTPSVNPETGNFGYVFPIAAHAARNGTAFISFFVVPWEGFERQILTTVELNNKPAASGYVNRIAAPNVRYVSSSTGSDSNDGLTLATAYASFYKALAQMPSGGTLIARSGDTFVEDLSAEYDTGNTKATYHKRRVDVVPSTPGSPYSITRSLRGFTQPDNCTISVNSSGVFTLSRASNIVLVGTQGPYQMYFPATGEFRDIATVSGTAGTLGAALANPVSSVPFLVNYGQNQHLFTSNNIRFDTANVDLAKIYSPAAGAGITTAPTLFTPGGTAGTYSTGSSLYWTNSNLLDANGPAGPRVFSDDTSYPAPNAEYPEGTGYWADNQIGDETLNNPANGGVGGLAGSLPSAATDPFGLSAGFCGFYKCNVHQLTGGQFVSNCVVKNAKDINYLTNNNVLQVNSDFAMTDYPLLRVHRDHTLTVYATPTYDGTYTTIPVAGVLANFKSYSANNFQTVQLLPGGAIGAALSRTGVAGVGGAATITGGYKWAGISAGGGVANAGTVSCYGDATGAQPGDKFVVFDADHTDFAQFGRPPGSSTGTVDQYSTGQQHMLFQHCRYTALAALWVNQQNGQNSINVKSLAAAGTITTTGGDTNAAFTSTSGFSVGDIILGPTTTGALAANYTANAATVQLNFAVTPYATLTVGSTSRTVLSCTGTASPYIVTLEYGLSGSAIASGTAASSRPTAAIAAIVDVSNVTLAGIFPALSGAAYTREIGISVDSTGLLATFSSAVFNASNNTLSVVAQDDFVFLNDGPGTHAYARMIAFPSSTTATLSSTLTTIATGAPLPANTFTRWRHAKSCKDIAWVGCAIDSDLAQVGNFHGRFDNAAQHFFYQQCTINPSCAPNASLYFTTGGYLPQALTNVCGFEEVGFADCLMPNMAYSGTASLVGYGGYSRGLNYKGFTFSNNQWATNTTDASGSLLTTSPWPGVPVLEAGAAFGAPTFDSIGFGGSFRVKTSNPPRAALGNSKTGGLLMPAAMNWTTRQIEPLAAPIAAYAVGSQPLAVA